MANLTFVSWQRMAPKSNLLFKNMEVEDLFSEGENVDFVEKCLAELPDDCSVLRALGTVFSLKEPKLFENACRTSKKVLEERIKNVEKKPETCMDGIKIPLEILSLFQTAFTEKACIVGDKHFLITTSDIVFCCLSHCKISEQVYGNLFNSLADYLSNFFKKCCQLLEQLLCHLCEMTKCDSDDEIWWLEKIMKNLSKCGVVLINLEIKTMAKVWKGFTLLLENHVCLRGSFDIEQTIIELCGNIIHNMETICDDNFEKVIKLNCFLLKLTVKFCTLFSESFKRCHESVLNLLLTLCRWDVFVVKATGNQDMLSQLTIGIEPLLVLFIKDELFVRRFDESLKNAQFSVLCCLVMKKLINCDTTTRSLWFNKKENILEWIFTTTSTSEFTSSKVKLPNIVLNGKQTKFTDLYEYVLVMTCAFLMTATADEYCLVEKTLFKNILQTHPIRALFGIDVWCLLARFAGSDLCFSQIVILSKTYQELHPGSRRIEKLYLGCLIRRLNPLLSDGHKELFFKSFPNSFYNTLWEGCCFGGLGPSELSRVRELVYNEVGNLVKEQGPFTKRIIKLWKFNIQVLVSSEYETFMKILLGLTSSIASELSSEDLYLIVTQIKKLLTIVKSTSVQLYITKLLKALSTVFIPPGIYQKKTITIISDIFNLLLSSQQAVVKQKSLETFYTFAHITSHSEIISLTVQDSPELKIDVTNYFKKTPPQPDFDISEYFNEIYKIEYKHVCLEAEIVKKKMKLSPVELKEVVSRWNDDGKQIVECFEQLSDLEKRKVKNVCQSILYLSDN